MALARRKASGMHSSQRGVDGLEIELVAIVAAEHPPQRAHRRTVDGFVEGDAEVIGIDHAQVDARFAGARSEVPGAIGHVQRDGVEERRVDDVVAETRQSVHQDLQQAVHAPGDEREALGAVIHRVETGNHRQQHLRGADVAGGLLAADVLLARLQAMRSARLPLRINRYTDDAARHGALVIVARGEERRVRTAKAHGHAEALRAADGDVRTQFTRRLEQRQRQKIGRHDGDQRPRHAAPRSPWRNRALRRRAGIGQQRAETLAGLRASFRGSPTCTS
jgi:hypothetical protein